MAEIDVKFMKADRKAARSFGSTYRKKASATPKKTAKPKRKK